MVSRQRRARSTVADKPLSYFWVLSSQTGRQKQIFVSPRRSPVVFGAVEQRSHVRPLPPRHIHHQYTCQSHSTGAQQSARHQPVAKILHCPFKASQTGPTLSRESNKELSVTTCKVAKSAQSNQVCFLLFVVLGFLIAYIFLIYFSS